MSFSLKPHQIRCIEEIDRRKASGKRFRTCITSNTGTGKSKIIQEIIRNEVARGGKAVLYSNRKLLTDQILHQLKDAGIHFGCRAAEFEEHHDPDAVVQLCSIQTERARVLKKRQDSGFDAVTAKRMFPLAEATLCIIDEIHSQKGDTDSRIIMEHYENGADIVGVSATPLGIGHLCDDLVFGADTSEGRQSGLLVKAFVKGCPEIDTRKIERVKTMNGEFSVADIRKHCWCQAIYGYVAQSLKQHNPDMKPFLLYAPGVEESVGFESHLRQQGIKVAHIDGTDCVVNGERYRSSRKVRNQILDEHRKGLIHGITNRFVFREAFDAPWVEHLVLATPIGSLTAYIQTVGRGLRASPSTGKSCLTINDHGGNYWRHGSPNQDRHHLWAEYFHDPDSETIITDIRMEQMRSQREEVPLCCPQCGSVQLASSTGRCYQCDHDMRKKQSRFVVQRDGTLVELTGAPVKPRREVKSLEMEDAMKRCFWATLKKNSGRTFSGMRGWIASGQFDAFSNLGGCFPARGTKWTPMDDADWFRDPQRVDPERIHGLTGDEIRMIKSVQAKNARNIEAQRKFDAEW